jgi:hypothetical protein
MPKQDEFVAIELTISKVAYDRAQTLFAEKDPHRSVLGELREHSTIEDLLGLLLEERLLGDEF